MDASLFRAILAMDSYNRGNDTIGQSVVLPTELGVTKLGDATISKQSDIFATSDDVAAGFYAIAYNYGSQKIISYRGTDKITNIPLWDDAAGGGSDMWNGYGTGAGSLNSLQSQLALQFYKAVVGNGDPLLSNVFLTGHSLGGGLAGYISALYHQPALLFNNMAYQRAASNANFAATNPDGYAMLHTSLTDPSGSAAKADALKLKSDIYGTATPWTPIFGAKTIYMDGEGLSFNRVLQSGVKIPYFLESDVSLDKYARHNMNTLVMVMFGKDSVTAQDWTRAEKYFIPSLYDNDVGLKAGADKVTGTMLADKNYSGIMRETIAYSAIDEGSHDIKARPFGDTGIRALFNDANELGKVLASTNVSLVAKDFAGSISDIFVQFAGKLAIDKVLQVSSPTAVDGVLTLYAGGGHLDINFGNKLWGTTSNIEGRSELFTTLFTGAYSTEVKNVDSSMQKLWGTSSKDIFEHVTIATKDSGSTTGTLLGTPATGKANLFMGGGGADSVTGSSGKDLILGNFGIDSLSGGGGKDILLGGKSNDKLIGGADTDRFIINNGDGWDRIGDRQQGDRIVFNGTELTGTATYQGNGVYSLLGFKLWQSGYSLLITSSDGATTMEVKEFFTTSNGVWFDTTNIGITVPGTYQSTGTPKTYTGTEKDDLFNLVGGPNTVNGLGGNDTIYNASKVDGGTGNDYIRGTSSTDVLNGGGDNDIIVTNGGLDIVNGGTGNDRIISGVGAQKIFGDGGIDTVEYSSSMGGVEVNLALTTLQEGGTYSSAYGDILSGIENITGSSYADTLTGNTANNVLTGRSGADRLTGGMGADVFKYNAPTSAGTDSGTTVASRDVITDFANGIDKIDLAAFAGTFTFMGKSAFTGTPNQLNYAQVAGNTIINLDTDGNKIVDGQIQLLGPHNMTATDFVL